MFINGRFLSQRTTGVQRFAREIIQASAQYGLWRDQKVELLAPSVESIPDQFAGLPVHKTGRLNGHLWEQAELPFAVGDEPLINLCSTGPLFLRRQMIVLHDAAVAAVPENFTWKFRAWYQLMIRTYGHTAAKVGTVSQFSADEIVKHFGIDRGKIEIIPESGEHILQETPDYSLHDKFGLEADGYFLAVSSLATNKNFAGILKAVAQLPTLPFKFVIVGGKNAKIFSAVDMNMSGATEVGYVSDAQLRALYERAACFVYPSTYEGFGLPPLEAMSCGCPVLVSNVASLPEICGNGAAYCDPFDAADIARQLASILGSANRRAELRQAGVERARAWTWKKAAERLRDITL